MAIDKSLEGRLGQILPQPVQLNLPDPLLQQVDNSQPVDTEVVDDQGIEPVQVAGIGSLKGLLSGIKKTKSLAPKGADVADEAANVGGKIDTPSPVQPQVKVTTQISKKVPKGKNVAAEIQGAESQLKTLESTIEVMPSSGTTAENVVNLNRIEGPDDFKQAIEALNRSAGIATEKLTFEEVIANAKSKGFSTSLISEIEELKKTYGELPTNLFRLRVGAYQHNRNTYNSIRQSYLNPDDDELLAKVLYNINFGNAINDTYKLASTRAAQATATGRIQITPAMAAEATAETAEDFKGVIPEYNSKEMKDMLNSEGIKPELKKLIEAYSQLTDESAQLELINKVGKVGLISDLWDRTWKSGLLSGTGTHVVNLTSNTTFLASSLATRKLGEYVALGKRSIGLNGEIEMGEASAMVAGMVSAWRDGLRLGAVALKTGTTREMREGADLLSDAGQRFEGNNIIFDSRQYGLENETLIKGVNGWANFVTLLGTRPIMAMDEVFKTMGYRAELYAQAHRASQKAKRETFLEASARVNQIEEEIAALKIEGSLKIDALKAEGKPTKFEEKELNKLLKDAEKRLGKAVKLGESAEEVGLKKMGKILTNPPKEVDEAASDFSHMITFSRKLTGASKKVQELAEEHLVGRIILPFVKTPIWVTSESMQHSAMAPLSSQWRADIKAGGARSELAMAKFGMGTGLMIGVGSYVADGRMTGGGPGDTALRNEYLASGWRPYSFVFRQDEWDEEFVQYLKTNNIDVAIGTGNNLYVPFRGIDPIAGPLSMITDAVEYARYEDDQDKVGQVILGGAWGLYNYVGQMSVMTAISSITGAFTQTVPNPKAAFRSAIDAIVKQAVTAGLEGSPPGVFSSARGQVARAVDPYKRDISEDPNLDTGLKGFYEGFNYAASRTPGLSDKLPHGYDYLGEKENRSDPENPWVSSSIGIRYSGTKQREADKIIIATQTKLDKPRRNVDVDGINVKLTPDEYSYMMNTLGLITMPYFDPKLNKNRGMTIKEAIVAEATSEDFGMLDKNVQQDTLKRLYSQYVQQAKFELLQAKPSVRIRAETARTRLPIYGNP
jgi:hypothetical protein